jgi:NarL family two-component system response regulator LiaR
MKNRKIHILIADDHALMRVGIRSMLESQSAFDVTGECCDGESAVKMAQEIKPDVIIMDLMMPKMNGAEATKAILESNPEIKIIVLTSFGASVEMAKAIQAGAAGALLKESPSEELIKAIFAVMNGETAIHSEVSEYIGELECQPELTQRQLEILTAIAAGNTDKAIADEFKISIAGVRKHLLAITSKLGACSRTEAVSIALRKRLLKL